VKEITADIFTLHANSEQRILKICPTNGTIKSNGACVMGAGIAKELALDYPCVPFHLGRLLSLYGNNPYPIYVTETEEWWSFPVKHEWNQKADLSLIDISCLKFKRWLDSTTPKPHFVLFPRVGCGNGELSWKKVRPMLESHFKNNDEVIVVSLPF